MEKLEIFKDDYYLLCGHIYSSLAYIHEPFSNSLVFMHGQMECKKILLEAEVVMKRIESDLKNPPSDEEIKKRQRIKDEENQKFLKE